MISKTFCVNPWITLHYYQGIKMNPCCVFRGSISAPSIESYATSQELQIIKSKLLNNEAIPQCIRCWDQEQQGHTSKRQRDNKTYEKIFLYKHKKNISES
jgi:hypothetical protein